MEYIQESLKDRDDETILAVAVEFPSAFELLVERYRQAFLRKAAAVVHDRDAAEDIVQDTFVKIYRNAKRFKTQEGATFKSWAYKILINTSLTEYNKAKRRRETTVSFEPEAHDIAARDDARIEERLGAREQIRQALTKVPAHFARIIEAYYINDKSHKAIAEAEGVTVDTVKMRLFRARKQLKEVLSNYA